MSNFIKESERINLSVELSRENGHFCAYISDENGGSGISVDEETTSKAAEEIAAYIEDYFYKQDEEEDETEEVE
jgi:hypothetical protein